MLESLLTPTSSQKDGSSLEDMIGALVSVRSEAQSEISADSKKFTTNNEHFTATTVARRQYYVRRAEDVAVDVDEDDQDFDHQFFTYHRVSEQFLGDRRRAGGDVQFHMPIEHLWLSKASGEPAVDLIQLIQSLSPELPQMVTVMLQVDTGSRRDSDACYYNPLDNVISCHLPRTVHDVFGMLHEVGHMVRNNNHPVPIAQDFLHSLSQLNILEVAVRNSFNALDEEQKRMQRGDQSKLARQVKKAREEAGKDFAQQMSYFGIKGKAKDYLSEATRASQLRSMVKSEREAWSIAGRVANELRKQGLINFSVSDFTASVQASLATYEEAYLYLLLPEERMKQQAERTDTRYTDELRRVERQREPAEKSGLGKLLSRITSVFSRKATES